MLTQIQGVIFDTDGLMLDTEPLYRNTLVQAAQELGHNLEEEFCSSFIGLSIPACRTKLIEVFGEDYPQFRTRRRELWEQHIREIGTGQVLESCSIL